jgi:hypothetical protein
LIVASATAANAHHAVNPPTVLTPQGIGSIHLGSGKPRAVAALTAQFGKPTGIGINTGCGSRYAEVVWTDLAVEFRAGVFTGYRYVRGGYPLTTAGSPRRVSTSTVMPKLEAVHAITLGSTLRALRAAYPTLRLAGVEQWTTHGGMTFVTKRTADGTAGVVEMKFGTCGGF